MFSDFFRRATPPARSRFNYHKKYIGYQFSKNDRILDIGSGGSTLFWLKQGLSCISIEHDPSWYRAIKDKVAIYPQLDYRLVLPEPNQPPLQFNDEQRFSDPDCYASADKNFLDQTFHQYVSQIDEFPDLYFDLIVVDGRARPSCMKHSIPKVKVGGIILLDNSERSYYTEKISPLLNNFAEQKFFGITPGNRYFAQTTAFIRTK